MKKRILFILQHPAHVHQFKHNINDLKNICYVDVFAIKKDITLQILESNKIDYELLSNSKEGLLNKICDIIPQVKKLNYLFSKNKIDLVISRGNVAASIICGVKNVKHIIFSDSEPVFVDRILLKFATKIVTPSTYKNKLGKKHIVVNSFKELAYLHPNYFSLNQEVLELLREKENQNIYLIRLVSWKANHDINQHGLSLQSVIEIIRLLEEKGIVYISSENTLPPQLNKYCYKINPQLMHSVLYYCTMLICDSQTMATEAALLGTPVIRINSFVGKNDMGNFIELENKYDLIYNYNNAKDGIKKIKELIHINDLKKNWMIKRDIVLKDKSDMSAEMLRIIKNELMQ